MIHLYHAVNLFLIILQIGWRNSPTPDMPLLWQREKRGGRTSQWLLEHLFKNDTITSSHILLAKASHWPSLMSLGHEM